CLIGAKEWHGLPLTLEGIPDAERPPFGLHLQLSQTGAAAPAVTAGGTAQRDATRFQEVHHARHSGRVFMDTLFWQYLRVFWTLATPGVKPRVSAAGAGPLTACP